MTRTSQHGRARGRDESDEERLDRLWADLLQELRVMQTGAQLTAGFLLTLPFQSYFRTLDTFQTTLYLVLVVVAALTTALVLTPVAIHRRLSGAHVKERLIGAAHLLVFGVLASIGVLITGMTILIFDVVVDRTAGLAVGAAMTALVVGLLALLPGWLTRVHR